MFSLSFTGRLDRLDWSFYWGDVVSMLLLPPLFIHFALMFPERADSWAASDTGRKLLPLLYLPALLLGAARVAAIVKSHGLVLSGVIPLLERIEILYLAISLAIGLVLMTRALKRVRSVTARRQLRWIVWGTAFGATPFVLGYAAPFALGFDTMPGFEWSALLLGARPAVVRVGHRPVSPHGCRGDHQARAGLHRGSHGHRRNLCGAARSCRRLLRPGRRTIH